MTHPLFDWLPPPLTQHVALALVHFLWQGTLAALVLAVILRLVEDRVPAAEKEAADRSSPLSNNTRANARYMIACFGLMVMAALPVVNLWVTEPPADPAAGHDPPPEALSGESLDASGEREAAARADTLSAESMIAVEPTIDASIPQAGTAAATTTFDELQAVGVERDASAASVWSLMPFARPSVLQAFFWVWLAGVALLAAWHLLGCTLAHRLRRAGRNAPDEVIAVAGRIARRLGISRVVAVRQTLRASAPVVIGWIKPALLLPASVLSGLAPHELEAVFAHELAHVRRHDYLVNLVQTVVETLLFYHPALWWLSRRIRCEREFCADDLAMRACQGREVYVRSLIAVAESSRRVPSPAVAATGASLLARVRRILQAGDGPSPSPGSARRSALAGVLAALCLGAGLMAAAQNRPADDSPAREEAIDRLRVADEPEEIPGKDLRAFDSEQRPAAAAQPARFRIDSTQTTTPEWQQMIARCEDLPRIRAGHGEVTLMRVVLEEGDADAPVQMMGTKLVLPKRGTGGGRYLQIRNGDFALLDHINSARRREGKDPVEIGNFTHYPATIWVTVPPRGTLGVLGDVVLSPVPEQEMGRIVATVDFADEGPLVTGQLRVGPVVVGGPYGRTFYFDSDRLAYSGRIAPGSYKILLPDFDMVKSRWTVDVSPGELTRLQFLARSQKDVEKIEEVHRPETELETRLFEARKPDDVKHDDKPAESRDLGASTEEGQQTRAPAHQPRRSGKLPEHVSTLFRWLAADTELMIVAKDFELPDPKGRGRLGPPLQVAGTLAVWPLPGPTMESLSGRPVRWAVHGGRNCEIVSAFGSVRQEGASIIRFDQELPDEKLRELRNQLRGAAEEVRSMAGHDVYVFPPDRDSMEAIYKLKPWQGQYVVLPSAETMITATSDAYLSELFGRMATAPREIALPLSLPEWKYLDREADVWLLRHLPDQNPNPRLRVPEGKRKLRGLVWGLRGETKLTFRATYLPMPGWEKEVAALARRWFVHPGETEIPEKLAVLLEFTTEPDGSVTLAIPGEGGVPAEIDPQRFLAQELEPDDARMRLFAFFTFGLHASQGLWQ